MKTLINLLVLLSLTQQSFCQLFQPDPVGVEYYNKGSDLLRQGFFNEADSMLTLALCSYKNENVYYNRAVSKLLRFDTAGYCEDMDIAANKYFDEIAEADFNKMCCRKVDTIYFDKNHNIISTSDFRYYEVIRYLKYNYLIRGSYHDIKAENIKTSIDFGCNNNLLNINTTTTDMIASYFIEDTVKFYVKTTTPARINSETKYNDLKRRAEILLNAKYGLLKSENNLEHLTVYFEVFINDEGETIKVKYKGFFPEISSNVSESDLEIDLLDIADSYPKVIPAKFFKQKVYFAAYDFVDF